MLTFVERLIRQVEGDPACGKCEKKLHGVGVAGIFASLLHGELERKKLNTSECRWLTRVISVLIRRRLQPEGLSKPTARSLRVQSSVKYPEAIDGQ